MSLLEEMLGKNETTDEIINLILKLDDTSLKQIFSLVTARLVETGVLPGKMLRILSPFIFGKELSDVEEEDTGDTNE